MNDFLTHEEVTQLLQGGCPELEASYQFTKNQIAELEGLRNKVAEQAAVIEKLRETLIHFFPEHETFGPLHWKFKAAEALAIPTDSKQILAEWLDAQLGEPVAWESHSMGLTYENHYSDNVPLFKKPEVLK